MSLNVARRLDAVDGNRSLVGKDARKMSSGNENDFEPFKGIILEILSESKEVSSGDDSYMLTRSHCA